MRKITALLPMKAHSERVPEKNIKLFAGKPLFQRIAEVLETSVHIDRIFINTDSEEIAKNAGKHFSKVEIVVRPPELRGDFVPMNDIIRHDIQISKSEHFLQTHSTNPLLGLKTIETAIEKYFNGLSTYDSLFSVTKVQNRFYWESGEPINHNPGELLRTQDLEPIYEENSNIYLFSAASFAASGNNRIGLRPQMFSIDKLESIDIDDEADWHFAESLYHWMQGAAKGQ